MGKWESRTFLTFVVVIATEHTWIQLCFSVLCLAAIYMMLREE